MQGVKTSLRYFTSALRRSPATKKLKLLTKTAFSDKYLLCTNVTISISLSSLGDYLEQKYEIYIKELETWNRTRTMHMGFSGMTVGVICHHWYKFLDRRLPGRTLVTVIKKMLIDQTICSPIVITTFFLSVALFEDITVEEFKTELKQKFWRLYAAEWVVWPPAQLINFYLLPTKYRVLYDNTISLGYDIFTSQVKHSKIENKQDSKEAKVEKQENLRILEPETKITTIKKNVLTLS
ncbi:mpv17-like protein 2 isoform X1 [Arctopsyche grandis]